MRYSCLVLLLCATLAAAQAPGLAGAVPPDAPVITIEGACPPSESGKVQLQSAFAPPCKTVITRQQFEALIHALNPQAEPGRERQFADSYGQFVAQGNDAIKLGLDKDPRMPVIMDYFRMRVLAGLLFRHYQEEAQKIPDADVTKYYNENQAAVEELHIQRLFVPKSATGTATAAQSAAARTKADAMRARLLAGEPFDKLQQEAYTGINQSPPPTTLGPLHHGNFPAQVEPMVFALKIGEMSPVLEIPTGFLIYKLNGRRTPPFDEARESIRQRLVQQKLNSLAAAEQQIKPVLNDAYFAPAPQPQPQPQSPPQQ